MTIYVASTDERADVSAVDVRQCPITDLLAACGTETHRFVNRQPASEMFALELFRRAICERDEFAWEAVFTQYRGLVRTWLSRHPMWTVVSNDADDMIYRVFERFWSAVIAKRSAAFPTLAAVLRYLKLCAHSTLLDECRRRHMGRHAALGEAEHAMNERDPQRTVTDMVACEELWLMINGEIKNEAERSVVALCLELAMKPQEVYARYPERFASVTEVYTVKRNVLDRLRRNPAIREYLR